MALNAGPEARSQPTLPTWRNRASGRSQLTERAWLRWSWRPNPAVILAVAWQSRERWLAGHPKREMRVFAQEGTGPREAMQDRQELDLTGDDRSRISIFYNTTWESAYLHGSISGSDWTDYPFRRVSAAGGNLRVVHINASQNGKSQKGDAPLLEFVVHDGQGQYDKSQDGGNYAATKLGGYRLEFGRMHEIRGQAILLVSDLDDTMFGDDEASKAFKDFWERDARLRGGCLVYNTGRALDKWLGLWREKQWCLAAPDVLISSVGTKVYDAQPDVIHAAFCFDFPATQKSFQGWALDKSFAAVLDEGWNLETVREAAYKALAGVGRDSMHFRPPDEQNDHKITCGVKEDVLGKVEESINSSLAAEGIAAQLIVSGRGEWRFLDIVSKHAGKLSALEHVRQRLGFSTANTIACGDSGNDRDMLSGRNRAIVVANAEPELKAWLEEEKAAMAGSDRLYIASSDMALGIMEGLEHFGFK